MVSAVEQVIFVRAHFRQAVGKCGVDMHVAGRARTAAATQSEQFVKTIVADHFHQRQAVFCFDFAAFAVT